MKTISVEKNTTTESIGNIELEQAIVHWNLSIEQNLEPKRSIIVDGKTYEFTDGFTDLHTQSYQAIINENGFTTTAVKPSIDIVERIRNL